MKKTPLLQQYFNELHDIRLNLAKGLTSAEFKETFNGVIHKYRESAHFIYELLQNADDARATKVQMILEPDKFIFIHDGTERFTVSNPQTPEEDKREGKYGHINSITAVGFSTKSDSSSASESKIGKFGVGFKAIFEYTTTPYIYDDPFCFKIEHYIVPTEISDKTYFKKGKTVFVIPFDRTDITAERSYMEIEQKIKTLENPLLFLNNLETIVWQSSSAKGKIHKKVISQFPTMHSVSPVLFSLANSCSKNVKVLLMKQEVFIPYVGKHNIAIGYFLDSKGRIDTQIRPKIHCFFPTTESIDTCYVIHAPFLLVDNREQIKRDYDANTAFFSKVGQLAALSLLVLRDISVKSNSYLLNDNILDLMHFDLSSIFPKLRTPWLSDNVPNFNDYYSEIYNKENVFLTRSGKYILKRFGLWAVSEMQNLLSLNQLNDLMIEGDDSGNHEYDFILCSISSKRIEEILMLKVRQFTDHELASGITQNFMARQTNEWLNSFYSYVISKRLAEKYELRNGKWSEALMRYRPILKTEQGLFVAPYIGELLNVFFVNDNSVPMTNNIDNEMLRSCPSLNKLLSVLEIKKPSALDLIRIRIEGQHSLDQEKDNLLLLDILTLYQSISQNDRNSLIQVMDKKYLFACRSLFGNKNRMLKKHASEICINDNDLRMYYTASKDKDKYFFDIQYYNDLMQSCTIDDVNDFLNLLSFEIRPPYILEYEHLTEDEKLKRPHSRICAKKFSNIYGLSNALPVVASHKKFQTLSFYIWKLLCYYTEKIPNLFSNDYSEYYLRRDKIYQWPYCSLKCILKEYKWIYIDGNRKKISKQLYVEDLIRNGYEYNSRLFEELSIESSPKVKERESIAQMSVETNEIFSLGEVARRMGVKNLEDMQSILLAGLEAKRKQQERHEFNEKKMKEHRAMVEQLPERKTIRPLSENDFKTPNNEKAKSSHKNNLGRTSMNLEEVLSGFEEKINLQKEEFEEVLSLRENLGNFPKYSYVWLKSLMELEVRAQGKSNANGKKAIFLSFQEIVPNVKSDNLLVLRGASRMIPSIIEDIDEIPITFFYKDGEKQNISFDVASVKDDYLILKGSSRYASLIKKIKEGASSIYKATLEVERPIELIKYWEKLIAEFGYEDDYSLKANLRKDLKFIFGPPGTGKTTELAKRIINLLRSSRGRCRILVLAPTNKACDVLTEKILDSDLSDKTCIWRFVSTMSERIEEADIVYDRSADILSPQQVCVISTIARYSFDGFDNGMLNQIDWDYVIVDEASMIPLYQIIPPLYNEKCKNILIAGDPFQIEPIVKIDEWKEENIYSLISLNNFVSHRTEPVQFDVETLMTQYRSIPAVGEIYSQYMYGGKLKHNKKACDHRILNLGIEESPLNIISYPISKETIFEAKHLGSSNIQIYSVIFTVEFIKYIAEKIIEKDNHELVKIGVLSPYGAEIQAIEKMYNQHTKLFQNIEVVCGTSHGFQGDECDIVIAVMNPPATGLKRTADLTFINKANILNVAVSRAKDYLFVLIPSKEYECFDSLYEIKKLGRLMSAQKCKFYSTDNLEKIMFGQEHYIENNTFVTTHQTTNVYSDPFAKYEIRIDESAMDIQINEDFE